MGKALRVEQADTVWFITSRTNRSELWFIHCPKLIERMKAYLAKYVEKHSVIIYAHCIVGNHFHLIAKFPLRNKAAFMRDLNSITARLVRKYQRNFGSGTLFSRPHHALALLDNNAIEDKFLYTLLNFVSSGIVERIGDHPDSFGTFDPVTGISRTFKIICWRTYRDKKRYNKKLKPSDFEKKYTLTYTRLPGYEHLSQKEYEKLLRKKIEDRRCQLVEERFKAGKGFLGIKKLKEQTPGQKPKTTKTSSESSFMPIVQCSCPKLKEEYLKFYFDTVAEFRACFKKLKQGKQNVTFPSGTYPPRILVPI